MKSVIELVIGCAAIFISMPIWFYLQYKVLQIMGLIYMTPYRSSDKFSY